MNKVFFCKEYRNPLILSIFTSGFLYELYCRKYGKKFSPIYLLKKSSDLIFLFVFANQHQISLKTQRLIYNPILFYFKSLMIFIFLLKRKFLPKRI